MRALVSLVAAASVATIAACHARGDNAWGPPKRGEATLTSGTLPNDKALNPIGEADNASSIAQPVDERVVTRSDRLVARPSPLCDAPDGRVIASASQGALVKQTAQLPTNRGDWFLVLYPDPDRAGAERAGWIAGDALAMPEDTPFVDAGPTLVTPSRGTGDPGSRGSR